MSVAPRLEIDLDKIHHNALTLVGRLADRGISVTGVTKAVLGSVDVARTLLRAGVSGLGDSRIENIEALRHADVAAVMTLIRSPMLSQAARVVRCADVSCNTEIEVIRRLSIEAGRAGRTHRVLLMVELGDLREGILPRDLVAVARTAYALPSIELEGIGTNLACRSGVAPDRSNMAQLTDLAVLVGSTLGQPLAVVSGGNSANLNWALSGADTGGINNLRLGEAILLGRETLHRQPIFGLYTDAITLIAEVIESKVKSRAPTGAIAQSAFGGGHVPVGGGEMLQTIVALGIQDTDPDGLRSDSSFTVRGASSDHLIVESEGEPPRIGSELSFQPDYSALLRAMTSRYVAKFGRTRNGLSALT